MADYIYIRNQEIVFVFCFGVCVVIYKFICKYSFLFVNKRETDRQTDRGEGVAPAPARVCGGSMLISAVASLGIGPGRHSNNTAWCQQQMATVLSLCSSDCTVCWGLRAGE